MRAIADAVLYEGYVLWPYRRSAMKNQRRWTFGGVYPRGHSERASGRPLDDAAPSACSRASRTRRRGHACASCTWCAPGRRAGDGLEPVDELEVGGERHVAWDEAAEREVGAGAARRCAARDRDRRRAEREERARAGGRARAHAGDALDGARRGRRRAVGDGAAARDGRRSRNTTPWAGGDREDALRRTFCSTHAVLRARRRRVRLADRPAGGAARAGRRRARTTGCWPVLVGERGRRDTLLSSPIILEDHPRIAPESPGDLFDGGEIDQMLVLNILSLTDEEKARCATPTRARARSSSAPRR